MREKLFVTALCVFLIVIALFFSKIHNSGEPDRSPQVKSRNTNSGVVAKPDSQEPINKAEVNRKIAKLRIPFIANRGQTDQSVKFYASTFGGAVFVTDEGEIVYSLPKGGDKDGAKTRDLASRQSHATASSKSGNGLTLKEEIVGGKISEIKGEGETVTKVNYFKGNDRSEWKSNIPTYDIVSLGEVYKGIEVKLKAHGNTVEKLFFVKPESDPEKIKVRLDGSKLNVSESGELEVETELGTVKFTKPLAYQENNGKREFVEVAYVTEGNKYGFNVGDYDRTKELVIDPILAATFLGGSEDDDAFDMALGSMGDVYVTGLTHSVDFPGVVVGSSADSDFVGELETFVVKLDPDLSTILAATFVGGSGGFERARAITLDDNDNVYIAGDTNSTDFPGVVMGSSADSDFVGNSEAFVAKLDSNLSTILAATFLGGNSDEDASDITLDSSGNVYVVGGTNSSPDLPGVGLGSADNVIGLDEGFAAKLDSDLSTILAATFLGGSGANEDANAVVVDGAGNVYVAGRTGSSDFPCIGASPATCALGISPADSNFNNGEGFVVKLDSDLSTILAATFLGGSGPGGASGQDIAQAITLDGTGNVYVAGDTSSLDFPGIGPGSADSTLEASDFDAFVAKLNPDLSSILAATFLGGSNSEFGLALTLNGMGDVYVAGITNSSDFPGVVTGSSADSTFDINEAFIAKLNSGLSSPILAATFLGGSGGSEFSFAISLDGTGNVYVTGITGSSDFPCIGASPATCALGISPADSNFDNGEAFVAKLDPDLSNNPPDCGAGVPSISELWSPNHNFATINILEVTDPDGDIVTITVDSIFQDEPVKGAGGGNTCPDGSGLETDTAQVRAERSGNGDGRVYHIGFTADDGNGATCTGEITVCVLNDQGQGNTCVDGGALFDSTVCP